MIKIKKEFSYGILAIVVIVILSVQVISISKEGEQSIPPETTIGMEGFSYSDMDTRIIGGVEVNPECPDCKYPFMGSLMTPFAETPFCGAVLIDPQWVLTAAHCVLSDWAISGIKIGLGYHNVITGNEGTETPSLYDPIGAYPTMQVRGGNVIIHPLYVSGASDDGSNPYDFTLIHLNSPITNFEPIQLITDESYDDEPHIATITGWGMTTPGGPGTNELREANSAIHDDCGLWGGSSHYNPDVHVCVGGDDPLTGACAGDSGGPAFITNNQGEYELIGIASWGPESDCTEPNLPTAYARVAVVKDWILEVIDIHYSDTPICQDFTACNPFTFSLEELNEYYLDFGYWPTAEGICIYPDENGMCPCIGDGYIELFGECYNIEETTELDLSWSGLTGLIPIEICNLTNLEALRLSGNQLSGGIPECICDMPSLVFNENKLRFHNNAFCPPYSDCIEEEFIGIQNCESTICEEDYVGLWGWCYQEDETYINLQNSEMQFTATIPEEICTFTDLNFLMLASNQFTGEIPGCFCDDIYYDLTGFSISNNQICLPYPECLSEEVMGAQDVSLGDVNNDGTWNVLDIVKLVNCVLAQNCGSCAGDLNGDGVYNILDIVTLANCVLAQNCNEL